MLHRHWAGKIDKLPGFSTYSVPDGVLNGGVGTIGGAELSTDPGGNVKFNLFFDILLIASSLTVELYACC